MPEIKDDPEFPSTPPIDPIDIKLNIRLGRHDYAYLVPLLSQLVNRKSGADCICACGSKSGSGGGH